MKVSMVEHEARDQGVIRVRVAFDVVEVDRLERKARIERFRFLRACPQ